MRVTPCSSIMATVSLACISTLPTSMSRPVRTSRKAIVWAASAPRAALRDRICSSAFAGTTPGSIRSLSWKSRVRYPVSISNQADFDNCVLVEGRASLFLRKFVLEFNGQLVYVGGLTKCLNLLVGGIHVHPHVLAEFLQHLKDRGQLLF